MDQDVSMLHACAGLRVGFGWQAGMLFSLWSLMNIMGRSGKERLPNGIPKGGFY